jgi:hypothetical protein
METLISKTAHCGGAGLGVVRLRPVFANVLPDLKVAQLGDQPGPQQQTQAQRRQAGERRAHGDIAEHAQRAELREELLVEEVV